MHEDYHWSHQPDHSRSIMINGDLDGEITARVLKKAATLMKRSEEPITLYVNSNGGSIHSLILIEKLLASKCKSGESRKFITVATGRAQSAAANLVVMGHYAYIGASVKLVFHGARYIVIDKLHTIRKKDVVGMLIQLERQNFGIAQKMSCSMISRVIRRYLDYRCAINSARPNKAINILSLRNGYVGSIYLRMQSRKNRALVKHALSYSKSMMDSINNQRPSAIFEKMPSMALAKSVQENSGNIISAVESLAIKLMFDFLFLRKAIQALRSVRIKNLLKEFDESSMSTSQRAGNFALMKRGLPISKNRTADHINVATYSLWCFTLSLSWLLMNGNNVVSATDAYWLGLVDEVLATHVTSQATIGETDAP